MHIHFILDDELKVVSGEMIYQVLGEEPAVARAGDSAFFKWGVPHKIWNSGNTELNCSDWINQAHIIIFYLSAIFAAQKKTGKSQHQLFEEAYLIHRYNSEYDLPELQFFVKKIKINVYFTGKLTGKYSHFKMPQCLYKF